MEVEYPSVGQESPLDGECSHQQIKGDAAVAVPLEEGHEEPEADEDHDVHVLENWKRLENRGALRDYPRVARCGVWMQTDR